VTSVRILVARAGSDAADSLGTLAALTRLGSDARVEVASDAERAAARCDSPDLDLVVAEWTPDSPAAALLERLAGQGPPVVVVCPGGDGDALEAFRRGAADCVVAGSDSPLPQVALEQIRRSRASRERAALQQLHREVLQKEKMASIGQLAAGVAHEINNPIGFIHANLVQMAEYVTDLRRAWSGVEALQKAVAGGAPDEVARAAAELAAVSEEVDVAFLLADLGKATRESLEGSERVRHIVQDLRDFSRRDTGERLPADINECLESTVHIVWPMVKQRVRLEKRYGDLPPVPCNPMQLKQVFMNLLVNAYQAVEERVGESGALGRIELSTERQGAEVVISVRDDGAGIPPQVLDRIFDPFFTTKSVGVGTGLGLSTSFQIVERHGGKLSARSRPGEDTVFEVRLPLGEEDACA
jgi:two-component system NtrC family sensor kinase